MRNLKTQIRKLSLQKGDILVIEKSFTANERWMEAVREAGKTASIDFNVPIVFVDSINGIAIVRMGQNG